MRCPICDKAIDQTQVPSASQAESCPLCRAIWRDAAEAQEGKRGMESLVGTVLSADRPLVPIKRTPGVEDVFNWY